MKYDTAGDPISGLKWTRKTTGKISTELKKIGISVCPNTVGRLLKKMGYSLKVNCKKIESGIKSPVDPEKRNNQFELITVLREEFSEHGNPVLSVDTKKKELIGNFKNNGDSWELEPAMVMDHDFPSDASGKAIPYGIYDIQKNKGSIYLGTTHDTPSFAVDSIKSWWDTEGQKYYPDAKELLILADGGGSNSSRSRVWKYKLQKEICDMYGISVYVCHYPPGSSKWNPIEHRLFSEISKNWKGKPLTSYEKALKYIRTTRTTTGLEVNATFVRNKYETGEKISNKEMKELTIEYHKNLTIWNYVLKPSKM